MQKPDRNNSYKEKKVETFPVLTANKIREFLNNLDAWQLTDDHKMIYREFILQDFMAAIDLINRIALIAEDEKHHPAIHLTQYRNLRIGLTTHDVSGISGKDLIVARKINDLLLKNKEQAAERIPKIKNKPAKKIKLMPKKNGNAKVLPDRINKNKNL